MDDQRSDLDHAGLEAKLLAQLRNWDKKQDHIEIQVSPIGWGGYFVTVGLSGIFRALRASQVVPWKSTKAYARFAKRLKLSEETAVAPTKLPGTH